MRLLMLSGDQQVAFGERGPFYTLLEEFREHFDGIDVLVCPALGTPAPILKDTSGLAGASSVRKCPCPDWGALTERIIRG